MSLQDKTFVVTGANTGIGRANVLALAEQRAGQVIVAARSLERTQPVLDEMRARNPAGQVDFVALDLGSLAAVRPAADEMLAKGATIDVLVANAGIAGVRGQTTDGFELAFGTNHLGHYLLIEKLLPLVRRAKQGRIVIVASHGHYRARRGIDWDALTRPSATVSAFPEYCVSKLCNVLHAKELARRLAGTPVTVYAVHPGGVASDIWSRRLGPFAALLKPFLLTNEQGTRTQLRCAIDPALAEESGLYYERERPREASAFALDVALQDELRARSDAWVRSYLDG
ncbi:MAG: SDR family NAD(P)-dependent oxidoreductase [Polyangiaceae bacterium]